MALILASGSPRRRELMSLITPDYTVITSDVDETKIAADSPAHLAKALATAKARAVAEENPDDVVCAHSPGVSTASTPASASAGAAVPPPLSRQPLFISRPSRRTTCAPTCARRSPTTRREPMPSKGTRRCGVRASKGATTTSWGCRFTARRSCCASLPDPDSPGNGSLYGKNLQLFYMLFRENTRYVYQRHRH